MDINITMLESILSGIGGGGAAILFSVMMLRKSLGDLSARIDHTEEALKECRRNCDSRLEKGEIEFRQIISALNEIKVQIARGEALDNARNSLAQDIVREFMFRKNISRESDDLL